MTTETEPPTTPTPASPPERSLGDRARGAMLWDAIGIGGLTALTVLTSSIQQHLLHSAVNGDTYVGQFSVLISAATVLGQGLELGIEQGLARYIPQFRIRKEEGVIPRIVGTVILFRLAIFAVVSTLLLLSPHTFAALLVRGNVSEQQVVIAYLPLFLVLFFVYLFQDLFFTLLVTSYQQKYINGVRLLTNTMNLFIVIGLVEAGFKVTGLLSAGIIAGFSYIALLGWRSWRSVLQPAIQKSRPAQLAVRAIVAYTATMWVYNLMANALGANLDVLLLNLLMPSKVAASTAAHYKFGYQLAYQTLLFVVLMFAGGFILPLVSELHQTKNVDGLRRVYRGMIEFIYLLALPMLAMGAVLSPQVINVLYSGQPPETALVASAYFVSMGLLRIGGAPSTFLAGMGLERWLIVTRVSGGVLNFVLDVVLIPPFGIMGPVIGTSVSQVFTLMFEAALVHRAIHPAYPWAFLGKMAGISLVMAGVAHLVGNILMPDLLAPLNHALAAQGLTEGAAAKLLLLLTLAVAGGAGGVVFLAGLILLKPISPENMDMFWRLRIPGKARLAKLLGVPPQV